MSKQRTPSESAALRAQIIAGLHAYKEIPVISDECGIPPAYCYTIIRRMKLGLIFVSAGEKALIAAERNKAKWRKVST